MDLELFIARRIIKKNRNNYSSPIIKIAIISIALGLATMILAYAILTGFQKQISDKVIGFGAHIQITNFDLNRSFESTPICNYKTFYKQIDTITGIKHIQIFATKLGLIATKEQNQGAVLKGIGSDYNWSFFKDKIIEGTYFIVNDSVRTNDVLISKHLASKLKLKLKDKFTMYFIVENNKRPRPFTIKGIYETGLEEFDDKFVLADIAHIQKLNKWGKDKVGGFEIFIDDFEDLNEVGENIYYEISETLDSKTIKELHPEIFDWLELSDMNVIIIFILMVLVAGITMISTILILILERTNMIGILKALGARNWSIRKIFLYNAAYLIGAGLFWGNLIALTLAFLQIQFGLITLPQESYYVSHIPINLNLWALLLINTGTLLTCLFILIIPTYIIAKISPIKAIRFD